MAVSGNAIYESIKSLEDEERDGRLVFGSYGGV
jgi:hypothetical protein